MGAFENIAEKELDVQVKSLGGFTRKYVSPSHNFVPDRIVFLNNVVWFIEVKGVGEKPNGGQMRELKRMRELGVNCGWVQGLAGVAQFIKNINSHDGFFDGENYERKNDTANNVLNNTND